MEKDNIKLTKNICDGCGESHINLYPEYDENFNEVIGMLCIYCKFPELEEQEEEGLKSLSEDEIKEQLEALKKE